jgi:hypothetical protein
MDAGALQTVTMLALLVHWEIHASCATIRSSKIHRGVESVQVFRVSMCRWNNLDHV